MDEPEEKPRTLYGFTLEEAETIQGIYVCSQCEGYLTIVPEFFKSTADDAEEGEGEERYFLVCPDDGNIELIGRISRTTVAIRNEWGLFQYPHAIRALPELWGHLIPPPREKRSVDEMKKELGY